MHKITPNIHEVIAFTKWLSAKQSLPKSGLKSVLYSHIWTLGTNASLASNFIKDGICNANGQSNNNARNPPFLK
jgi:hypothetical protein